MSGVYYATVMVLTTAATVTGVMILSIHHKVSSGKTKVSLNLIFLLYPGPRGGRRPNLSQKSSSVSWEKSQKI